MENRKVGIVMIKKQITTIEMHFDSLEEFRDYLQIYEHKGYTILGVGAEDDWYFIAKKIEE